MKRNRKTLQKYFQKGQLPSEVHFGDLVDSVVNIIDDGYAKSSEYGLELAPQGKAEQVLSFFRSLNSAEPDWQLSLRQELGEEGLSFDRLENSPGEGVQPTTQLFLGRNGAIGIGHRQPHFALDVQGSIASTQRVGTFQIGQAPANREWHAITPALTGMQPLEVVAQARGATGRGRYAITHALALGLPGPHRRRIRQTRNYLGFFWNRIELRWQYQYHDAARAGQAKYSYQLQARTRTNYGLDDDGNPCQIQYHITRLWDEDKMATRMNRKISVEQ